MNLTTREIFAAGYRAALKCPKDGALEVLCDFCGAVEAFERDHAEPDHADRWPLLSQEYNAYLLDCAGLREALPFTEWVRATAAAQAAERGAAQLIGTLTITGRALHADFPAAADVNFPAPNADR